MVSNFHNQISRYWGKVIKDGQQQYEQEGCSKKNSKARFIQDNIKEIREDLRKAYVIFIKNWMKMSENSVIHQKIMGRVEELHDQDNLDWEDAARMAIKEYKPLVNMYAIPDEEINSDEEQEEEEEAED